LSRSSKSKKAGPARALLASLAARGFALTANGDSLDVRPGSLLTAEDRAALEAVLDGLLALLATTAAVAISGKVFLYERRWSGQRFGPVGGFVSFDTETELIPDDPAAPPPRLALASAAAGDQAALIHPDDVGAFVLAHRDLRFVGHNSDFDFWVVERHLRERGEAEALAGWWAIADEGRLHDSMLLDMLVRLARDDSFPEPRGLDVVAHEYAGLAIDKNDPYRMRYREIIGKDWGTVEPGFFSYAVRDAIATGAAHEALRQEAKELAAAFPGTDVLPDAAERFGLLTETVQARKAIALAAVERHGVSIDRGRVGAVSADLRARLESSVAEARRLCPELYKVNKRGELVYSVKSGAPSRSNKALDAQLVKVKEELREQAGVAVSVPLTKKAKLPSRSAKFWAEYKDLHPFLAAWVEVEETAKLRQFCSRLQQDRVHPRYTTLVRSGRTSASSPNIQQIPRGGGFRGMFVPSEGHFLLTADYSFIELRTLAAVCERRFGESKLADVIRSGTDPHAHTAAMMLGVPPEEFLGWKKDPSRAKQYEEARQAAKAVNFGTPGGLGAASLADYAKRTYKVPLTVEEAAEKRSRLVSEVYPELNDRDGYLAEDAPALVARNLGVRVEDARRELGDTYLPCIYKVLAGNPTKKDGQPYKERYSRRVWAAVLRLCPPFPAGELDRLFLKAGMDRDPDSTAPPLGPDDPVNGLGHRDLARRVCQAGVATLTGRIRGRVPYSAARNTPFQGLAADGAALALFALVKEGFRVVAFVHDEVLIELRDEGGYVPLDRVRRVEEILKREMEKTTPGVPVGVESALARRWDKRAKLVEKDGKVYPWEPPDPPPDTTPPPPDKKESEGWEKQNDGSSKKSASAPTAGSSTAPSDATSAASRSAAPAVSKKVAPTAATPASTSSTRTTEPPRPAGKLTPPLKWHGSKGGLAGWIVPLFPRHLKYVEAYAGSLAVLLARDPEDESFWWQGRDADGRQVKGVVEVASDLNGDLLAFYQALRDPELYPRLRHRLELTLASEAEWNHAREALEGGQVKDPTERAALLFVFNRLSRQGLMRDFMSPSTGRTRSLMNEQASAFNGALAGLAAAHERLRRVVFVCRPAVEVIRAEDAEATFFYLDPPYKAETRVAREAYGRFEMGEDSHRELLDTLAGIRGKFLLSGYTSPLYDLYAERHGWARLAREVVKHSSGAKTKPRATEVLWANYPLREGGEA
jgi:DNA adenine methylase